MVSVWEKYRGRAVWKRRPLTLAEDPNTCARDLTLVENPQAPPLKLILQGMEAAKEHNYETKRLYRSGRNKIRSCAAAPILLIQSQRCKTRVGSAYTRGSVCTAVIVDDLVVFAETSSEMQRKTTSPARPTRRF